MNRRHYIDTDAGQIHVTSAGDGPAVLLMHWVPLSGRLYEAELATFAAAGMRAIAVDLMGFGRSDRRQGLWSVERHAATMRQVLTTMGAKRVTLVGGHYSTAIAVELAQASNTAAIDAVALVTDGGPMLPAEAFAALLARAQVGGGSELRPDGSHREWLFDKAAHTYSIFAPRNFQLDSDRLPLLYRFIGDFIESGMQSDMSALAPYDFANKLGAVKLPTLMLTSETEPLRASFEPMCAARRECSRHEFLGDHPLHDPRRAGEFAAAIVQWRTST